MKKIKKEQKKISTATLYPFLLITFGLTWGLALLLVLFYDQMTAIFGEVRPSNPIYILAVYAPAFAAISLVSRYYGIKGLVSYFKRLTLWRMSISWWLFMVLATPAIFYLAAALTGTISDPFPFSPWYDVIPALLFMLVLGPVEEFGWRGFALPLLQRRFNPFQASLIIGIIWGIWHLPAFVIGGTPHSEWVFAQFFIAAVAISIIMTAMFNASRGSILTVALFHFQLNNPIWPDAQPWDAVLFCSAAIVVLILNRKTMFKQNTAITTIFHPQDDMILRDKVYE